MKTLLDRLNPLFPTDYKFRDIYMIATAAEDAEGVFDRAYSGLQGSCKLLKKVNVSVFRLTAFINSMIV